MTFVRRVGVGLAWLFGAYLVARALVEPFIIDYPDPASYRADWGGPSLAGVLAVHCGPGVIAAALMYLSIRRRRSRGHARWL